LQRRNDDEIVGMDGEHGNNKGNRIFSPKNNNFKFSPLVKPQAMEPEEEVVFWTKEDIDAYVDSYDTLSQQDNDGDSEDEDDNHNDGNDDADSPGNRNNSKSVPLFATTAQLQEVNQKLDFLIAFCKNNNNFQ
jgi:hypothetical protein